MAPTAITALPGASVRRRMSTATAPAAAGAAAGTPVPTPELLETLRADPDTAASRELTADEVAEYEVLGCVKVDAMFSEDEVALLAQVIEADGAVSANEMPMVDSEGKKSRVTLWDHAGDDTYSMFSRSRRLVHAAVRLTDTEVYHLRA